VDLSAFIYFPLLKSLALYSLLEMTDLRVQVDFAPEKALSSFI
jgi:hypothetical protein